MATIQIRTISRSTLTTNSSWSAARTDWGLSMKLILFGCCLLLLPAHASAACVAPQYRDGAVLVDSPSTIWVAISISFGEFTPAKLICLGEQLGRRYKQ